MDIKELLWYDIETTPNFFSVVFENYFGDVDTFVIFSDPDGDRDIDQWEELVEYIEYKVIGDAKILTGYNNARFDDAFINRLHDSGSEPVWYSYSPEDKTKRLFNLAQELINNGYNFSDMHPKVLRWLYPYPDDRLYESMDLLAILTVNMNKPSLKDLQIHMKTWNIMDLPFKVGEIIKYEAIPRIIKYNKHDVSETKKVTKYIWNEIMVRVRAGKKYDLSLLRAGDSKIAKTVLKDLIPIGDSNATHYNKISLANCLPESFIFDHPLIEDMKQHLIDEKGFVVKAYGVNNPLSSEKTPKPYKYNRRFEINGTWYTFGVGGLHSEDKRSPGIYEATDDVEIIDCDVTSYYPMIGRNNNIHPGHISNDIWQSAIGGLVDDRVKAKGLFKETGNPDYDAEQATLKIAINSGSFGFLGSVWADYYDPKALFSVTFGGQIALLDLIEKLAKADIQNISANTDGIICLVPKDKKAEYYAICEEWEQRTNYNLEYTHYKKYLRLNVNSYMGITTNDKLKLKKDFFDKLKLGKFIFGKGFQAPIVALTLQSYFQDGSDVEDMVTTHHDIFDFCYSQKMNKKFKLVGVDLDDYVEPKKRTSGLNIVEEYQKTNRWYFSTDGLQLIKINKETQGETRIRSGHKATMLNDYDGSEVMNINYEFYIDRVYEIIDVIEGRKKKRVMKPKAHQLIGFIPENRTL